MIGTLAKTPLKKMSASKILLYKRHQIDARVLLRLSYGYPLPNLPCELYFLLLTVSMILSTTLGSLRVDVSPS